jgi:hypothetical protein
LKKQVLIISFVFPPYPGIGGRRWAKFSKYLTELETEVFVLASENPFSTKSEWTKDIENSNVKRLPLKYPKALITFPKSFSGRINYKISKFFVQLFSKGNYYDKALFWQNQLLNEAKKIIELHDIKNVVISGAPFHLMHHSLTLKDWNSNLNLIVDFRDLWTDDVSMSALSSMSQRRLNVESKMELEVLNKADCVITVSDFMTKKLQQKANVRKAITIINGFDEHDFGSVKNTNNSDDFFNFVFTGSLYKNIDSVFTPFCEAVQKIKINEPDLYGKLNFNFYGTSDVSNIELVKKMNLDCIHFHDSISLNHVFEKISRADYCMLFLNDTYSFSLSTKFCEYIGLRKSIVLFSKEGDASSFITSNKLGFWINPHNMYEDLVRLLKTKDTIFIDQNFELNREKYSLKNITKELIESVLI